MPELLPYATSVPLDSDQINPHDQAQPPQWLWARNSSPIASFAPVVSSQTWSWPTADYPAEPNSSGQDLPGMPGSDGRCFPSCERLGADLGCSARQVQRYVAELVSAGFISAKQRGFNRSNSYVFLWHPDLDEPPRKEPQSATVATPHRTTDASSCSTTDVSPSLSATDVSPLRAGKASWKGRQNTRAHAKLCP